MVTRIKNAGTRAHNRAGDVAKIVQRNLQRALAGRLGISGECMTKVDTAWLRMDCDANLMNMQRCVSGLKTPCASPTASSIVVQAFLSSDGRSEKFLMVEFEVHTWTCHRLASPQKQLNARVCVARPVPDGRTAR